MRAAAVAGWRSDELSHDVSRVGAGTGAMKYGSCGAGRDPVQAVASGESTHGPLLVLVRWE